MEYAKSKDDAFIAAFKAFCRERSYDDNSRWTEDLWNAPFRRHGLSVAKRACRDEGFLRHQVVSLRAALERAEAGAHVVFAPAQLDFAMIDWELVESPVCGRLARAPGACSC